MKKIGKKRKEWIKARKKLIAKLDPNKYDIFGTAVIGPCLDCRKNRWLTPDHVVRRSQGGKHTVENIHWVCIMCHVERDQMGDPKQKKPKSIKANWQERHECKECKKVISMFLCPYCEKVSL